MNNRPPLLPSDASDSNANRPLPTGLFSSFAPGEQALTPLPTGSAPPFGYSFMQTLSSPTSIQQQESHGPSLDSSALQAPPAHQPIHHQYGMPAMQHAHYSMHDSGLGIESSQQALAKPPPLPYNTMQRPSSGQSSIGTASDSALVASPTQEHMVLGTTGISDIALLLSGAAQIRPNTSGKPTYPYATLITYAILQHPRKQMTLNDIYTWLMDHYPYFKTAGTGWKNSIRHNLSLNKMFVRIPRPINEPGKGAYWTVDLVMLDEAINARPKPTAHRYSPPRSASTVNASPYPMAGGTMPSVLLTTPNSEQLTPLSNPLMMGITSSISDKGILASAPPPGSSAHHHHMRRASLQGLPGHRYQPYQVPTQSGLGGFYSPQGAAAQLPVAPSALCNAAVAASAMPMGGPVMSPGQGGAFGPAPMFPLHPFSGASLGVPGPGLADAAAAGTLALQPYSSPAHPGSTQYDSHAGNAGSSAQLHAAEGTGRLAPSLAVQSHLQVRPTPSFAERFLASGNEAMEKDVVASAASGQIRGSGASIGSTAAASFLAAQAAGLGGSSQPLGGPSTGTTGNETAASIGDLSAYFAFMDAQTRSAQPPDKGPDGT
ncbi:hypothetical protein GGF46_000794 [Coemansia sp. RSA 552]|nr:hypothetical protein GGF46_000794 [Coemansia sp. RSA 552]